MVWDSSTPTKADNARDIDEFIRVGVKQALEAFFTFKNNGLRVEINNEPEDVGDIASKQYVDGEVEELRQDLPPCRFQISGCFGAEVRSISSDTLAVVQAFDINIPVDKKLVIRNARYHLAATPGSTMETTVLHIGEQLMYRHENDWVTSGYKGEELDINQDIYITSTGNITLYIHIHNYSGATGTFLEQCGWWFDFEIVDE